MCIIILCTSILQKQCFYVCLSVYMCSWGLPTVYISTVCLCQPGHTGKHYKCIWDSLTWPHMWRLGGLPVTMFNWSLTLLRPPKKKNVLIIFYLLLNTPFCESAYWQTRGQPFPPHKWRWTFPVHFCFTGYLSNCSLVLGAVWITQETPVKLDNSELPAACLSYIFKTIDFL